MQSVLGIGTDIAAIGRFRTLRYPERVAAFYLRENEWVAAQAAPDQAAFLASRFVAKEAVIKAVPQFVKPLDFEISKNGLKPGVRWHIAEPCSVLISISHEREYASAIAVATT